MTQSPGAQGTIRTVAVGSTNPVKVAAILTNELVRRGEAFSIGLASALARFLHPERYGTGQYCRAL